MDVEMREGRRKVGRWMVEEDGDFWLDVGGRNLQHFLSSYLSRV